MKYFVPEWERQSATIIAMPHIDSDWRPYLREIQSKMCEIITQIAHFQPVIVLYKYESDISKIKKQKNCIFLQIVLNDSWCRDFAPLSIKKNGKLILNDFIFNAWGAKYPSNLDNLAGAKIFEKLQKMGFFGKNLIKFKQKNFILEGGSVETNGETLLTTTHCLISPNRNRLNQTQITKKLKKYLGTKRVIWIENGELLGDDTDSHIDNLARFVDKKTIVYVKCYDKNDAHFGALSAMEVELKQKCADFKLVPLPLPKAIFYDRQRLSASYANFIFANGAIFVPTFGDKKNDKIALEIFKKLVKNRAIIPIDSRILIRQGGGIHCATMNLMRI
ncbi:agmatine deiminase family protein [Helicobacter sp. 23-1045]